MNEKAEMQGKWQGHKEGRQTEAEAVKQQQVWIRLTISTKSPRFNFYGKFLRPFLSSSVFFQEWSKFPAAHKGFMSQGSAVSLRVPISLF